MHLQLRVLEKTEFEKRLGKLERLMREGIMKSKKGSTSGEEVGQAMQSSDRSHVRTPCHR
jgi:hypothetical protein